ncbi:addiction module protein [Nostoc sphaeroides]|uniref:Addiction module protein n=1 Tax=Nostoc sphaeroides CCNUC1 TaxID=2653204 RepID=A0A5P8VVG8_9NOSO|nr:addiction module protein [Nostoc sphaeroides]QFS44385.1 addiction module protein [Nostoc sphaeroides CCNUC1]
MNPVFPELSSLSRVEKLQLIEDLWNKIADTPAALPVLDWQKQELGNRKAEYQQNPAIGSSWEDVKARISQQHG